MKVVYLLPFLFGSGICFLPPPGSCGVWRPSGGRTTHILPETARSCCSSRNSVMEESSATAGRPEVDDALIEQLFHDFCHFIQQKQASIVADIEALEDNDTTFSHDAWGILEKNEESKNESSSKNQQQTSSGGITRVLQGGSIVEKGACSLTVIKNGILSADRAATIRARNCIDNDESGVAAGDVYSAAALSIVLHTCSPMVPTFRSDVRVFLVKKKASPAAASVSTAGSNENNIKTKNVLAWFGGGADLTPYYLDENDNSLFHQQYKTLCDQYFPSSLPSNFSYPTLKKACDDYFYLPARGEHRGTGGIFFDDLPLSPRTFQFCQGVAHTWMPSWFPIVQKHRHEAFTDRHRHWQLLRRGRYLEFNLLYDRGVKFGLAGYNPRAEGVMVSAPPKIAYEYNHIVEPNSPEEALMVVLKQPRDWVDDY
jgi:coproporphyrinogen III oxidase